jgi:2-polyprenyl-3-methyl-5-hydroxy-6-metoxy-1,4-benzoquinol methylase
VSELRTAATIDRDDWDRHWGDYDEAARQNPAHEYRRALIFRRLGFQDAGSAVRFLDVGSGQGDLAMAVRNRFPAAQIAGLELSRSGVEISRQKVPDAQFFQRNLLEEVEVAENLRDWATHAVCSEVIEHVDEPCTLLKNARQYMAPGCTLIVTAPGGPMSEFDKYLGHRQHFRAAQLGRLLQTAGYIPESVVGAGFPFFNLYRCVVILRGKKLIEDVSSHQQHRPNIPLSARAAMAMFRCLFHFNLSSSLSGWQMIATARVPKQDIREN